MASDTFSRIESAALRLLLVVLLLYFAPWVMFGIVKGCEAFYDWAMGLDDAPPGCDRESNPGITPRDVAPCREAEEPSGEQTP